LQERKTVKTTVEKKTQKQTNQFLTFTLAEQVYGVDLFRIQEIRGYTPATPIPNVKPHILGVMNLRGTVLPVVDLRVKFGLPAVVYDKFTVIVIAMVADKMVGLLVDAVSDVLQVPQEEMREAPDFGPAVDIRFINGVFETKDHLAIALNLEKLLNENELAVLDPGE
jgi:purine-binding chemotaxis protein CheW